MMTLTLKVDGGVRYVNQHTVNATLRATPKDLSWLTKANAEACIQAALFRGNKFDLYPIKRKNTPE